LCFEYGGAVTNIAIMIDGERPIGAKARLISEPNLVFVVGDNITTCTTLNDLSDYGTPQAPAALLKCALLSIGILEINGKMNEHSSTRTSLQEQIFLHTNGYGIELHSWSNLPTGSGLGTSSILAACIIASAARVCSIHLTEESLVHAVLLTEQLLTTGGGYQDNVGGVYGGAKICRSSNTLPLRVTTTNIPLSQTFQNVLNDHLLLIYTGRARLARNLLQNVVRRWYARLPEIVETINNLTKTAIDAANAIEKEDLIEVGENLSKYWSQKKCMAEGCEPEFVSQMIECFRKSILGASLCGAGGGGFLVVLTKKPNDIKNLQEQLRSLELNIPGIKFHKVQIDTSGLTVDTAI
jgi:fucokinase